ncbi:uncharacterized protein LOC109703846 isoform X2 [Ananas comosus]|uniref:Uncharacterized protein LOC109703846 isoform X2 n=1 Tax=Ananas comosus TaxID=4615 RepID=A0A6P5EAE5_ANACO|nr:uncharacterized protein LOC109703846 isoform X2 [Ananas comosus]XP_020080161.1 uncharacterized protein LOC109703846 isoform X2 [Ananas comosus]
MHIEKNVNDNILWILFNIDGKSKDNLNARLDLKEMGIRSELHPIDNGNNFVIPQACYTLNLDERRVVCQFLANLKVPDGYSSNISQCVNVKEGQLTGMKSHDCHVFIEDHLPPAFRGILPKEVYEPLVELSIFFKQLCSKTLKIDMLERLEHNIVMTICKLELIFPPAFFDIMIHLPIHLPLEARLAGLVHYRWMYPFERYLRKLKSNVRNKAHPEGSIALAYLADKCLTFCSRYLDRTETKFNRQERNFEGPKMQVTELPIFQNNGRPLNRGKGIFRKLSYQDWNHAQLYILKNCEEVQPFLIEHQKELEEEGLRNLPSRQDETFVKWFESRV